MKKNIIVLILLSVLSIGTTKAQEKYALILVGEKGVLEYTPKDYEQLFPMLEFWTDAFLMWEMFLDKGYSPENVFVIHGDGADLIEDDINHRYCSPYPDISVVDTSASRENYIHALEGLASGQHGYPKLNEDDFLYIWTFGHGNPDSNNDSIGYLVLGQTDEAFYDYEMAQYVHALDCNKIVVSMQNCFSGRFVDDLEGENIIVSTPSHGGTGAQSADQKFIKNGVYYYAREKETRYGEPWRHGEYDVHMLSALRGFSTTDSSSYETDYGNFDLQNADSLTDGIVTLEEAHRWNVKMNSCDDTPQWRDISNIGATTSPEYPTVINNEINGIGTVRGITGVPAQMQLTEDLLITGNTPITFLNNGSITVNQGVTLTINENVSFTCDSEDQKIIVYGTLDMPRAS